jgi:hypothetical protein
MDCNCHLVRRASLFSGTGAVNPAPISVGFQFEDPHNSVIPKRRISRQESAVAPAEESRLLAAKAGFGMTRCGVIRGNAPSR